MWGIWAEVVPYVGEKEEHWLMIGKDSKPWVFGSEDLAEFEVKMLAEAGYGLNKPGVVTYSVKPFTGDPHGRSSS